MFQRTGSHAGSLGKGNRPDVYRHQYARSQRYGFREISGPKTDDHFYHGLLEGFKVDATDYLLKPFNYQDFLHAADKARLQHELFSRPLNRSEEGETPDSLFVKADYKMIRIDFRDILYIEGQSEYARIFRENQPPVMTLLSLKAIEERLPTNRFMRVHRSYIVHLDKVKEVARNRIIFAPDTYIPVGDQYKDNFNRFLDTNSLIKK